MRVKQSSSFPGLPAPCLHSRTAALIPSPGFTEEQKHNHITKPETHLSINCPKQSQTLTLGVLWEASCCRRGKGVHWIGSTGQLQTERSLALPESSTPSPILISLPLHAYWELGGIQRDKAAISWLLLLLLVKYYTGILVCVNEYKHKTYFYLENLEGKP